MGTQRLLYLLAHHYRFISFLPFLLPNTPYSTQAAGDKTNLSASASLLPGENLPASCETLPHPPTPLPRLIPNLQVLSTCSWARPCCPWVWQWGRRRSKEIMQLESRAGGGLSPGGSRNYHGNALAFSRTLPISRPSSSCSERLHLEINGVP